jgi:hypothetical protein
MRVWSIPELNSILYLEILSGFPNQYSIPFSGGFMKNLKSLLFLAVCSVANFSFSQDQAIPASTADQQGAAVPFLFAVDSIAFAAGIEAREPVGVNTEFGADIGKLSCWVRVTSPQAPVSLRFVWYKDGEKTMEWPYSMKSASGRVWSTKSVFPGNWKVDIVDDANNVIKSAVCDVK